MYESPIKLHQIKDDVIAEFERNLEDGIIVSTKVQLGIEINKEQLRHALQYDREQYQKGYKDGYNDAIDKIIEMLRPSDTEK